MTLVRPGDVIFSYAKQSIAAIGVAASAAYDASQPEEFDATWHSEGRRVDVVYRMIKPALLLSTFVDDLITLLPERHSPITKRKTGVQGYLFALPPKAGQLICDRLAAAAPVDELVAVTLTQAIPDQTTKDALVRARIGQGRWRQDLLKHWSGKCAVTGLNVEALLRASHIKPRCDSDNKERLDVHNGFMFSPAYDVAFDAGLISFDDNGSIMISPKLPINQCLAAGISETAKVSSLADITRLRTY